MRWLPLSGIKPARGRKKVFRNGPVVTSQVFFFFFICSKISLCLALIRGENIRLPIAIKAVPGKALPVVAQINSSTVTGDAQFVLVRGKRRAGFDFKVFSTFFSLNYDN